MEPSSDALPAVERLLTQHGVSGYFPTTITAPLDDVLAALERLGCAVEAAKDSGSAGDLRARPLGIHLEGPFLSHECRGVHPQKHLLLPTLDAFDRLWQASKGHIRVMTIAPELSGAQEVIGEAAKRGVCVSLGHSNADFQTARRAVSAGASHATHTFNAMRPFSHRDPGIIGEVLTDGAISADIISDGVHLSPATVNLFLKAKGPDKAVLITDAIAATGMPDGIYHLGGIEVQVKAGKCTADGKLAGSVLTMDRAIMNVMNFAGWDLQRAVRLASANPALVMGLDSRGTLKPGARADIVVLNPDGQVKKTIIAGAGV